MKSKSKHRGNKNKKLNIRQYEPDFKKAVVQYAEQKSTSEAKRRYGISESNIRRWRRLKNGIDKTTKPKPTRKSRRVASSFDNLLDECDSLDFSSSLDSMPLEQRLKSPAVQEPVLQSQPLSPTKLKVTRQSTKPVQPPPKPPTPEPPNEEICLRWNSHHTNMQSSFPSLLLREQYVDATLVAEGRSLKCHRLILSSCSPYFEEVLNGISPYQHPVLFMKDIPFWVLKSLCDFMYAGEVHIFQNKLEELLAVAESLKIKGLAGKLDTPNEEVKNPEPPKPVKEEKKDEREVKEKKRNTQHLPEPIPKAATKGLRSTYASRRAEKANKEALSKAGILDPLDLLEPVYEEVTKETAPPKIKETKSVPMRKGKLKKRKLPEEREESPPPMFLSRKGTRSRPNVKIPKYYHTHYERPEAATIVREPHTQPDPLIMSVDEIKSEPLDLDDNVIEIEDNMIGFTDVPEMVPVDEEIIGNYDSPIVNPTNVTNTAGKTRSKFKKINLVAQPVIMHVHSIEEKSPTVHVVDLAEFKSSENVPDKISDPLATESCKSVGEDPLNFVQVQESEGITITNVQSMAGIDDLEPVEEPSNVTKVTDMETSEETVEGGNITKVIDMETNEETVDDNVTKVTDMETSEETVEGGNVTKVTAMETSEDQVTSEVEMQNEALSEAAVVAEPEISNAADSEDVMITGDEIHNESVDELIHAEDKILDEFVDEPIQAEGEIYNESVDELTQAEDEMPNELVDEPVEGLVHNESIEDLVYNESVENPVHNELVDDAHVEDEIYNEFVDEPIQAEDDEIHNELVDEPIFNESVEDPVHGEDEFPNEFVDEPIQTEEIRNELVEDLVHEENEKIMNNIEENASDWDLPEDQVKFPTEETVKANKGCVSDVDVPVNITSVVKDSETIAINDTCDEGVETRDDENVLNEDAEFFADSLEKLLDK